MRAAHIALVTMVIGAALIGACGRGANRLAGTAWTLAAVDGQSVLPQATPWIRFDDPSHLSGSTGCNSLGGTWSASGADISFRDIRTTLIGCPNAVGEQETAFNAALTATRSYAIDGGRLQLKDGSGTVRLTFGPRVAPTPAATSS